MVRRCLLAAATLIIGAFASIAWAEGYLAAPPGFVTASGITLGTGLTSRVATVCGNSERVFDYILAATGERRLIPRLRGLIPRWGYLDPRP